MNFNAEINKTVSWKLIRNDYYTLIHNGNFVENTPFSEALFGVAEMSVGWW